VTDAFGGRGGIALYNRHLLRALCQYPGMERVIAIPRAISYAIEPMPPNLDYRAAAAGGKVSYLLACVKVGLLRPKVDLVICGHIHLLPVAYVLGHVFGCRVIPVVYGIEAWTPTRHPLANVLCRRLDSFISIRKLTARAFRTWAGIPDARCYYLPNCIEATRLGVGPRRSDLIERYRLAGKAVIMTAGRLDSDPFEKNKGFDEVLEVLPLLRRRLPALAYLVVGDGEDKERLVRKSEDLGVRDLVVFTGYVPDGEKADHYRLADVFAMPGSNPMFDRYPFRFVFLEALACGVPVVGCRLEDAEERMDPDASLIVQVDPNDRAEVTEAIVAALSRPKRVIDPRLHRFYFHGFSARLHEIVSSVLSNQTARTDSD
jgi:phosphatidylinositol alpha-1,6-mannosyltransferase